MILNLNGLKPLLELVDNSKDPEKIKIGTWAIFCFFGETPKPSFELTKCAILTICRVIQNENDAEVLADATCVLVHLSDGNEENLQMVIDTGVVPALVKQLE